MLRKQWNKNRLDIDDNIFLKKKKRKNLLIALGVVTPVIILAVLIWQFGVFSNNKVDETFKTQANGGGSNKEEYVKVKVPKWANAPYNKDELSGLEKEIKEEVRDSFAGSVTALFPTKEQGYTNDVSKELLEDGTENPDYSYVLGDDFEYFGNTYINRLINPKFGAWFPAQSGEKDYLRNLNDMFEPEVWADIVKTGYTKLPIMIDWTNYSFGGDKNPKRPQYIGEVLKLQAKTGNDNGKPYVKYIAEVSYKGYKLSDKKGVLSIKLVPNKIEKGNRVVISEYSLEIK